MKTKEIIKEILDNHTKKTMYAEIPLKKYMPFVHGTHLGDGFYYHLSFPWLLLLKFLYYVFSKILVSSYLTMPSIYLEVQMLWWNVLFSLSVIKCAQNKLVCLYTSSNALISILDLLGLKLKTCWLFSMPLSLKYFSALMFNCS